MIQFVPGKNPVMYIPIPSGQIQTYKKMRNTKLTQQIVVTFFFVLVLGFCFF